MAKYIIDDSTLKGLANALRKVTGEDRTYTPTEMIETITTIMDSATYILVDEEGNEVPAVYVDSEVVLDATDNDVREGTTYVSDNGVSTGAKVIPSYHTCQGFRVIPNGSVISIPNQMTEIDGYDYTKLQALICSYNTSSSNSVSTEKVIVENNVYNVQSTESVSQVLKNHDTKSIETGLTNDTGNQLILRYFMYKEIE